MSDSERTERSVSISAERWLVLEPLIDAALDLTPEDRPSFIDQVELKDGRLAAELRQAIEQCERTDSFFDATAADRFAPLLEEAPPKLLGGRFLIEREIARGGMATVYLAHDQRHDRAVAVKVLAPEAYAEIGTERFLREILVAARLQHAHIVPLYDSGNDRGWLYYVMPVMVGGSLRELLNRDGPLSLERALGIVREIGGALEYAHRQGLVHRDIKPENILFDDSGALLADFGIARVHLQASGAIALTGEGFSIGTPGYMSPEQLSTGTVVDARSDIYSLACVMHEMLVGVSPVASQRSRQGGDTYVSGPGDSRRTSSHVVPRVVESTLLRALAPNPNDRFASAQDFVRSLGAESVTAAGDATATDARRLKWAMIAVGLLLVTGVATGGGSARDPARPARDNLLSSSTTTIGTSEQPGDRAAGGIDRSDARSLYLQGQTFLARRTFSSIEHSIDLFRTALSRNPRFAPAYAGLALAQALEPNFANVDPEPLRQEAHANAARAIAIDDHLAESHVALAQLDMDQHQWSSADSELRRALALNAHDAYAHFVLSCLLSAEDRATESLDEAKVAFQLDPLSNPIVANLAASYYALGRNEEAEVQMRQILDLDSTYSTGHQELGFILLAEHRIDPALAEFESGVRLEGRHPFAGNLGILGYAYGISGKGDRARAILRRLDALGKTAYVDPAAKGLVWLGLGEHERAIDAFERSIESGGTLLWASFPGDPMYNPLRVNPRFAKLLSEADLAYAAPQAESRKQ